MSDYNNEAGLPPTIPPPDWIHNVSCYSPLLLDQDAMEIGFSLTSFLKSCMIVSSTIAIIITNILFLIILNKKSYKIHIKPQPRIILTALALNDLASGVIVLGMGLFPAVFECWPYGELTCQIQAIFRGTFNQQASLTLIVLALERYWATVHPLTFEGFCSKQVCTLILFLCIIASTIWYCMIVMPPGGFHFNINGLMVCEPYFISNNILAFAACLFYFPTTMILMYCYGTIFHSAKVKIQYKRAVLTALPFLGGVSQDHIEHIAKQILENKKICDGTSKSAAAISLVFIIFNTPWAVQQVITSCTRTIAPPFIDFVGSWSSNTHRFWTPIIYWLFNEAFRTELRSFCLNKVSCLTLSKTWSVKNGSDNCCTSSTMDIIDQNTNTDPEDDEENSHQEKHWGEILERTVSKTNLMLGNGTTLKINNENLVKSC